MMQTGYLVPLISGTQGVVALLLLFNPFVPLALAIIAPVVLNIALYHAFLIADRRRAAGRRHPGAGTLPGVGLPGGVPADAGGAVTSSGPL